MFKPPFCPRTECKNHRPPRSGFFTRHGFYHPHCRSHAVPRYRCRSCLHTFSRQTFRMDYRDRRPDLNTPLFNLITLGAGIRMSARRLGLSLRCTELKLRKIGRHVKDLNQNLRHVLKGNQELHLDESETFERCRSTCPLSVPILMFKVERFWIWSESAPIRPRGKMTKKRLEKIARHEKKHGVRIDSSRQALQRTLAKGREIVGENSHVTLYTDEKSTYPGLAIEAFGEEQLTHLTTNSKEARTTFNPLFAINHEEARMRDEMGRQRRKSWLASKEAWCLDLALHCHMAYRNLVRTRFNFDDQTPAQLLGFVPRPLNLGEVLSWKQCWGDESIHPLSPRGRSVKRYRESMLKAA